MKNDSMKKKLILLAYIIFSIFIVFLTTSKPSESGIGFLERLQIPHLDKFLHFSAYAVHGGFSVLVIRHAVIAIAWSFFFSSLMEVIQYFLPYRTFELMDLVANLIGCVAGGFFIVQIEKYLQSRQRF